MSNPSIILHWYPFSPFAQKIAWALNYKKVDYKQVLISHVEPRPERRPLDSGYRRTPIVQIGNHTYCDTKLIFDELERRFPEPSFYPAGPHGESTEALGKSLGRWLDSDLFMSLLTQLPGDALDDAFLEDRTVVFKRDLDRSVLKSKAPFLLPTLKADLELLQKLVAQLSKNGNKWALGTDALSLLDLHVAMSTWMASNLLGNDWVKENFGMLNAHLKKTLDCVKAEEVGSKVTIDAKEAIEIAKRETSETVEAKHDGSLPIQLGNVVSVTPTDTGVVPSVGKLIYSTLDETIIEHKDDKYGTTVYIHFPVIGYIVVPV
ncbi:hypothetical protein G6F56_008583 [Rhizopus delemar]|uniref:GST N-terminal domain-containing protein n=1 Tax=Rhizopus stolonifer TaxID=4846 RepID=A0A367K3V2_RHIST|nr:hypothetical protein G6F56_008583 [Rhizopus delemar]RCH96893.1 hypothetical protein CU098_004097 [Rhizopus stolonifer]